LLTKLDNINKKWYLEIPKSLVDMYHLNTDATFKVLYDEKSNLVRVVISRKLDN